MAALLPPPLNFLSSSDGVMSLCRSEWVRPRLAALALAGLLLGQTLVPCGMLLSNVGAAELRLAGKNGTKTQSAVMPAWVQQGAGIGESEANLRLAQLATKGTSGRKNAKVTSEAECLDCEVSGEPLDLSKVPTEKSLRRAGGRDGALYPMRRGDAEELGIKLDRLLKRLDIKNGLRDQLPPKDPRYAALTRAKERYERAQNINMLFGRAVKEWREGERAGATQLFGEYMEKYPQTPWAGESALHLGYAAKNEGRLLDAVSIFEEVLDKTSDQPNEKLREAKRQRNARGGNFTNEEREADVSRALEGALSLEAAVEKLDSSKESDDDDESFEIHMKAKQQLADIEMAMGHYGDASQKLGEIMEEDTDWHRRVWARTQLQRASFLANEDNGATLLSCGPQALGVMMVGLHKEKSAEKVKAAVAKDSQGFSMAELRTLAAKNGVALRGFRADVGQLPDLALPAILHYDYGRDSKGKGKNSGHFVVLQGVDSKGAMVRLFNPLTKSSSRLSFAQLERQWSGQGLSVSGASAQFVGARLDERAMKAAVGSSTTFASTHDIGDVGNNSSVGIGDGISAPAVTVNQASMNVHIDHTVTTYQSSRGPSTAITLTYNSDSSGDFSYFGVVGTGRKWGFNYSSTSYLNHQQVPVNTSGSLIVVEMPDGSQDLYHWEQGANRYVGENGNFNWIGRVSTYQLSGRRTQYQYVLSSPDGTQWYYEGDNSSCVLRSVTDTYGYSTWIYYADAGAGSGKYIERIVDATGGTTTFGRGLGGSYTTNSVRGVITSITDPLGRVTTFRYDDYANLAGVTDGYGRTFNYTYDTQFSDVKTIQTPTINDAVPTWSFNREGPSPYNPSSNYPAPGTAMGANVRLTITIVR